MGRLAGITKSLRPYRFVENDGDIAESRLSPERGQLLQGLIAQNVFLPPITQNCDFQFADLRRATLAKARILGGDLRGAELSESDLRNAKLCGTILPAARSFSNSNLEGCDFHGALVTSQNWLPDLDALMSKPSGFDVSNWSLHEVEDEYLVLNLLQVTEVDKPDPVELEGSRLPESFFEELTGSIVSVYEMNRSPNHPSIIGSEKLFEIRWNGSDRVWSVHVYWISGRGRATELSPKQELEEQQVY